MLLDSVSQQGPTRRTARHCAATRNPPNTTRKRAARTPAKDINGNGEGKRKKKSSVQANNAVIAIVIDRLSTSGHVD